MTQSMVIDSGALLSHSLLPQVACGAFGVAVKGVSRMCREGGDIICATYFMCREGGDIICATYFMCREGGDIICATYFMCREGGRV